MPKIIHKKVYKGPFIDDQSMFWLDLPEDQKRIGLEPEVFRLAELEDLDEAKAIIQKNELTKNPWESVPRYDVLYAGKRLDGTLWKYLCVTVGAGTGKTMATEQAEYLLAENDPQSLNIFIEFTEILHGVNSIMGTSVDSAMSDKDTPLLIKKLQSISMNGRHMSGKQAWELLHHKIRSGKLTLIVDAIDQFGGTIDVARESAVALREFLERYPGVRCVVSGRPYAVKRFHSELFAPLAWDFVQLGTFTEPQRIRRVGQKRWDWAKKLGTISMGVPRWLDVLFSIPEDKLGDDIRTLSDLYLKSLESLIEAARNQQPDALKPDRAWYLFSLLAFEMMTDPKGPFRGQSAGIKSDYIGEFKMRIWDERGVETNRGRIRFPGLGAEFKNFDEFDSLLGQLGSLNEMLDDPVIAGTAENPVDLRQIFWRDQTLQDMFAALWMTRWATAEDRQKLRSRLFVRWDKQTHDYEDMWRLATEMPGTTNGRNDQVYIDTMSVLYEPSTAEQPITPSTEMIWRSWQVLEQLGENGQKVLDDFRNDYHACRDGLRTAEAQRVALDFESWFEDIDPTAAGWSKREVDDNDKPLPIVDHRYRMAKYTVTNELFSLFDGRLSDRYKAYGHPLHVDDASQCYVIRPRVPVVAIDWYDAWCFAHWTGGSLPTDTEWEYACRAGTRTAFAVGNGTELTSDDARSELEWDAMATDVDAFAGNAWGLFQMHGNVWEWCDDWYNADQSSRCLRGGSFGFNPQNCRSAFRSRSSPSYANRNSGVRVSRVAMK